MGYIVPIVFVIGIFIGFLLSGSKKTKFIERDANNKIIEKYPNPSSQSYPFLNPLAGNKIFRDINMCETSKIEEKIKKYVKQNTIKPGVEIAVYFRDLSTNYKFGINEYSKFSPSSLMKVPVMIAALKKAEGKPEALKKIIVFPGSRENEIKGMDASTDKLRSLLTPGNGYTVDELIHYMILNSDNEATFLLLDYLTEDYVHQVERDLGYRMDNNVSFYDDIIGVKQYSSFFRVLYNASYLNEEMSNYALEILSDSRFGHGIRKSIPENIKVAHKYGSNGIPISNHELKVNQLHHFGIVYIHPKPFLLGIMTRGDNEKEMERYIKEITEIIYKEVETIISTSKCSYLERDIE
ncbi:MAG: class A beta-lactamase-related serine hydrolase [Saprospiraceae bacterium]|nr:class A beta-lactamase-related serine hydrolase [Saprospiraceae bacterium]